MPTNPYLRQGIRSEQRLHENLIIEALQIYGQDCYYLPRSIVNRDTILNEDVESKFSSAFKLEMYVANVDGFEGDGQFLSKFGLEVRDQVKLVVARKRWDDLVGRFKVTQEVRPAEGDLIYFPLVNGLFEIKFVVGDAPFYQLNNLPIYELTCEMFEYSHDVIDTGIDAIDDIGRDEAYRYAITLGAGSGTFQFGEKVTQVIDHDTTIRGELVYLSDTSGAPDAGTVIHVTQTHDISSDSDTFWQITSGVSGNLIGSRSGASYAVTAISTMDAIASTDPQAQNAIFEDIGNDFVDFSEVNPFGEMNYVD